MFGELQGSATPHIEAMFKDTVNMAGELHRTLQRNTSAAATTAKLRSHAHRKEELLAEMQKQAQHWQDYLVEALKYTDRDVGPITSHLLEKGTAK